ncbi:hypothetical protein D0869_13485 [Hortaea werneckii]|uniref:Heterokaryon incompatibility domain-containing protein n=1 Tax=Hortaea werneckii TaxID=91943 RepID=A0A3M6ZHY0_HORWE|nr:hypothetical protein D0869_13485 [Hortaea werneckii]RMY14810.1 hypothetical protein D0868_01235 [Hortaea werneckii]
MYLSLTTYTTAQHYTTTLDFAEFYIRLLKAETTATGNESSWRVTCYRLACAPRYHAISYTWGSSTNTNDVVLINDRRVKVRANCYDVLRQARSFGQEGFYWVDALCINQEDIQEKSAQVAMMGEIFERAEGVLACVGPRANESEILMQKLRTLAHSSWISGQTWPVLAFGIRGYWWIIRQDPHDLRAISEALVSFLRRPYFQRLWILQELFRKQSRTTLCCGTDRAPFKALFTLRHIMLCCAIPSDLAGSMPNAEYIKVILDNFLGQHFGAIDPQFHQYEFPSQAAIFALDISFPGQRRSIQEQVYTNLASEDGLKEVIAMAATCECEDPRDRAFGTLALIDWQGQQAIRPDYTEAFSFRRRDHNNCTGDEGHVYFTADPVIHTSPLL